MGCYDTVTFQCPGCGDELENHSKAGACDLVEYSHNSVPLSIAGSMAGEDLDCPGCGQHWVIRVNDRTTVQLVLDPAPEDD